MYDFVTHTFNTVKGECPHKCSYCYMDAIRKRFNKECKPAYLDEKEFKTNLGENNFIFVGSSNDLFAEAHPEEWIIKTLDYCDKFNNQYLFQSKNPERILQFIDHPVFKKSVVCTTIESDLWGEAMGTAPHPIYRSNAMESLSEFVKTYVTIEPILDYNNLDSLLRWLKECNATQINVGADSGHNHLPEPSKEKILKLIEELEKFTVVKQKSNLKRLLK